MSGDDLPTLNAVLNSTSAVLLIAGYVAVRSKRIRLHKTCMLSAFGVSAAFLVSYLYYHFAVKHGEPTYFTDRAPGAPGWVARLYSVILVSHTILAVVSVPLILFTIREALRGRFGRHVLVARWTLPIWLYVSITGVVVYWMLYRLYP
jgi:putative membrane protein